jgi:hypothetical protein
MMKMKHKRITRHGLVFLGIMLGIECLGLSIVSRIDSQLSRIDMAIYIYVFRHRGKLPDSLDELTQFLSDFPEYDDDDKPLGKGNLVDPWGEPIGYEYSENGYIIWSTGPDKKLGTADDVVRGSPESYVANWKAKHGLPVDKQGTNAVGGAQASPPSRTEDGRGVSHTPKDGRAKPSPASRDENEPAENKPTPWKLPLLIGALIIGGGVAAWRYLKKK